MTSVRDWIRFGHNPSAASAPLAVGTSCVCQSSCRTFSSVTDSKRRPTMTQRFPRESPDFRIEWPPAAVETRFSALLLSMYRWHLASTLALLAQSLLSAPPSSNLASSLILQNRQTFVAETIHRMSLGVFGGLHFAK